MLKTGIRPAFLLGSALEAWQKWPIAPDLKPGGRSKGRPARSNRAASFCQCGVTAAAAVRGGSERVRVRFSPLALCRPGGIGRRAGFRIQSERERVQVSRPVLPIWRNRQNAPDLKPGGVTRASSMLAIGIEARCMQLVFVRVAEARQASAKRHDGGSNPPTYFFGESGSAATAVASKTTIRRFESCLSCLFRSIAQLAERRTLNAEVPGSSPGRPVGDVAELANAPVC